MNGTIGGDPDRRSLILPYLDLILVCVFVVMTNVVVFYRVEVTSLRVVLGLLFLIFLPGYALVSAIFPRINDAAYNWRDMETRGAVIEDKWSDAPERIILSLGLSLAVVGLTAVGSTFTPFDLRLFPIVGAVSVLTLAVTVVAIFRRRRLPRKVQFRPFPPLFTGDRLRRAAVSSSGLDKILNILLLLALVFSVGGIVYATTAPNPDEGFTEFYLLNETTDGELTADNYPTEFRRGEAETLAVGIRSQESSSHTYSVVIQLQRVSTRESRTTVIERWELDRLRVDVASGDTAIRRHQVSSPETGSDLRLVYLLYRGQAPADPSIDTAYRELHLQINVSDPA